jgi:mRNA-degrading endonuclease RelE of RelBE toxin-antitoxin system
MINFTKVPEFDTDFAHLKTRFSTLDEDFDRLIDVINLRGAKHTPGTFRIAMGANVKTPIYKVKQFRCKCLINKGHKSGFRIIFAHKENPGEIVFIQIYHKDEDSREDQDRIRKYFEPL